MSKLLVLAGHSVTTNVLAVSLLVNAFVMMFAPPLWWRLVPGLDESGPINHHFVRDVGLAFLTASVGLLWSVRGGTWRVALLGALFICSHSVLHVLETAAGLHRDYIVLEIVTVHAPAWLALASALVQWSIDRVDK